MAARDYKNIPLNQADAAADKELLPLLDAIARRHPASPTNLRERLRGGDYAYWPSDDSRAKARNEVHSLIDDIADRLGAKPFVSVEDDPVPAAAIWDSEPAAQPEELAPVPLVAANRAERMPFWATQIIPLTAVSVVALTTIFIAQFAPDSDQTTVAGATGTAPTLAVSVDVPAAPVETAGTVDPAPLTIAPVAPVGDASEAPVETSPETTPIPAQPEIVTEPEPEPVAPIFQPPAPRKPAPRFIAPTVDSGSAIAHVSNVLLRDGVELSKSQQRLIGADLNAAIDAAILTGEETLSEDGFELKVGATDREMAVQQVNFKVASDVTPLPAFLELKSGWKVASVKTPLHRGPDTQLASLERFVPAGAQVQTVASLIDDAGQAWTLIGMNGVAVGYLPSDVLTDVESFSGRLGYPYSGQRGYAVNVSVEALTDCQLTQIQTASGKGMRGKLCRDAYGNWVSPKLNVTGRFAKRGPTVTAKLTPLFGSATP